MTSGDQMLLRLLTYFIITYILYVCERNFGGVIFMTMGWTILRKCNTVLHMDVNFRKILKLLEDLLFPSICEGCGEVGCYLCDKCVENMIRIRRGQQCHVCKKQIKNSKFKIEDFMIHRSCKSKTYLDGIFVIAEYSKFVEDYIGDIKYEFYFAMIGDLVKVINRTLKNNADFLKLVERSVFTFVPLSPVRKRWRGFNQAEIIAQGIAEYWGNECVKVLKRIKNTKSQVGLKREQRLKNIKEAFKFVGDIDNLREKNIFIVDDVMTSGGTLEECAKALKAGGCASVYGLVFARG